MHATRPQKHEWQPVIGFAWSPGKGGKTVIRGGGLYWETNYYFEKWRRQSVFGPLGQMLNIYNQQIGALQQKFAPAVVQKSGPIAVTGLDVGQAGHRTVSPQLHAVAKLAELTRRPARIRP